MPKIHLCEHADIGVELDDPTLHVGETYADLVRSVAHEHHLGWSSISEGHVDFILWEHTAFPFADHEHVRRQVDEYFARLPEMLGSAR